MTNPSASLRDLAEIAATPEHARLILDFAARLEAQHNQQNNNWQAALGGTDLHLTAEIERLRTNVADELMALREAVTGELEALHQAIGRIETALKQRQVGDDDASTTTDG